MRTGFRFPQHLFCAFPMSSFRLRHVFVTSSARLRGRSSNALGLSNLGSDSPHDSAHFGRWYLGCIGGLNASSTLGSLAGFAVVDTNGARGLLFDVASSWQAPIRIPPLTVVLNVETINLALTSLCMISCKSGQPMRVRRAVCV